MASRIALFLTVSLVTASGCTAPSVSTESGDGVVGEVESPIINATNTTDVMADGVVKLVRFDLALGCSSVLITNQWLLTAGHCVSTNWPSDRTPMLGSNLKMTLGTEERYAAEVRVHPTLDAAVVRVAVPFPMNGAATRYLRPLYTNTIASLAGADLRCVSFGARQATTTAPMGPLGEARLHVSATEPFNYLVSQNILGQQLWYGDSGGPCFLNGVLTGIGQELTTTAITSPLPDARQLAVSAISDLLAPIYQATKPNPTARNILWWDPYSSSVSVWRLDGGRFASTSSPGGAPANWSIQATGDFDGDGEGDILWRDSTGQLAIWFLSYGKLRAQAYPGYGNTPAPVGLDWTVQGVGDFNSDGKADILWRNNNGQVGIWYMNGGSRIGEAYPGTAGPEWKIRGIANFNTNLRADILWRNDNGQLAIWYDGTNSASYPGAPGNDWQIAGVGDFNANGIADILWRGNNGQVAVWTDAKSTAAWYPGAPGAEWTIRGVGDFDGNLHADILWQDASGQLAIWFNGNSTGAAYPAKTNIQYKGILTSPF